jgi:cellulose synthase/poly-beta-1,6-N-acetylglucosamine synthase-like glycosyltransferase
LYSDNWIRRQTKNIEVIEKNARPIYVIIPALAEVGRIEKTVEYFIDTFSRSTNIKIVLVSTESEFLYYRGKPNTIDLCAALAKTFPDVVLHFHYPQTGGKMSHQLNFAVGKIEHLLHDDDLLAIYNADSRPHPATFRWVLSEKKANPGLAVFQQYGDYAENINRKTNGTLLSAALWQNRWAVGFELFKAIRSSNHYDSPGIRRTLNYCIGHGLFITKKAIQKTNGFSETFHNEDAVLGLELSFIKERISPVPFFDVSDTPDTMQGLYKQKIHWFFGPFQAFAYFNQLRKKYKGGSLKEKFVLFAQSCKLFSHAVYWLCGPTAMVFIFLYPVARGDLVLLALAYAAFFVYFAVPNILSLITPGVAKRNFPPVLSMMPSLLYGGIVCYFLHGLSGFSSIALSIKNVVTGKPINKGKTFMKST